MLTDGDIKSSLKPTASTNGRAVLTKTELIEEVLRVAEIPRKEAAVIVARILDSMVRAIDRGDKGNMDSTVSLPNTGVSAHHQEDCGECQRLWQNYVLARRRQSEGVAMLGLEDKKDLDRAVRIRALLSRSAGYRVAYARQKMLDHHRVHAGFEPAAVALGRKGGNARLTKLTPEERSEIARKAGLAGGRGRKKAGG